MHPNRATATAVVAFGLSYVAAGVVLLCFIWDPEVRRVVPVGIPNAESVAILTVVALFGSAAFGGGLWVAGRRGRVVAEPFITRACLLGALAIALLTLSAWLDADPPAPPIPVDGGGFRFVASDPPATPLERLAAVLLIFGVPAALGFGLASKPRRLAASTRPP